MKVFNDLPSVGFGLVFLSLSAGQFVGPLFVAVLIKIIDLDSVFYLSAALAGSIVVLLRERSNSSHE